MPSVSPIKFIPNTGDGAYDGPIRTNPSHNYIFLNSRLTLEEAKSIMLFWMGWDPRTPIDFIVIFESLRIRRRP